MTISVSNNIPTQELRVLIDGEIQNINSDEYFEDKKIILVGVPGAFTPTCHLSMIHLLLRPGLNHQMQMALI